MEGHHSDERHTELDSAVNQNICDGFRKLSFGKLATIVGKIMVIVILNTPISCAHHPSSTYQLLVRER